MPRLGAPPRPARPWRVLGLPQLTIVAKLAPDFPLGQRLAAVARWGYRMGDGQLYDSMLRDGLNDASSDKHSGWPRLGREIPGHARGAGPPGTVRAATGIKRSLQDRNDCQNTGSARPRIVCDKGAPQLEVLYEQRVLIFTD